MIHVIVGHAIAGRFTYRILTPGTRLAAPMGGISATPLLDACRMLRRMGAADDAAEIGLFNNEREGDAQFRLRTTIGHGAVTTVKESESEGPRFAPYRPPQHIREGRPPTKDALKPPEGTEIAPQAENATGARSAISAAEPPPPHKRQASPAGKDRVPAKPAKPRSSPRKPKLTKSGGRRGQR